MMFLGSPKRRASKRGMMRMVCNVHCILVVEDEPLTSSYVAEVLVKLGFVVTGPASLGPVALALAERDRRELALVDIRLSGPMDGIELAQLLLQRFGVPSIFLSGFGDVQTIERARVACPLGFLQKPFRPSQVFNAIDRVL
jgi:CheY-like chemotaxis protein